MKLPDLLEETYFSLTVNKVRTGLTMLGIIIGIGSVIAMVSIGQGAQGSIESSIQSIGSNLIIVTPGAARGVGMQISQGRGSAQTLTQADSDAIASQVSFVSAIAPEIDHRYQITAKGTNTNVEVVGTVASYPSVRNVQLAIGSFITDQNVSNFDKVAVLGPQAASDLFNSSSSDVIGQMIRVNNVDFTVVGVDQAKGGGGFGSQDDMIFVPISTAQRFLEGDTYVSQINIQAQDQNSMALVQQQVTNLLLSRHNISDPQLADFSVMNQNDIVATASSVTNTFTIFLAAIAGISLIVGGIGIMNMMITTVTERTREIGLRKAIGAKKKDISMQFLTESAALTFIGGFIGVVFGWLTAVLVAQFAGIATQVSWVAVILAFGVSAAIGIIFGYYPARQAASLNPIEALRYE
ncbi:MAG: ABC transporter permease [Patescibacteria group bacterium]|nr:ABC transporter permease [Patescibacteria group bacterium]